MLCKIVKWFFGSTCNRLEINSWSEFIEFIANDHGQGSSSEIDENWRLIDFLIPYIQSAF